jgi:Dolichyl-phosphate-mannose-protein mannosyltransferase
MAGEASESGAPAAVVDDAPRSSVPSLGRAGPALSALAAFCRAHWLFLTLFAAGIGLRIVVLFAYQPALFSPDSRLYLEESGDLQPSPNWPIAYAAFLRLLPLGADVAVIPFVQHVFGLLVAALLYALMLRLGVSRWLAALAPAPVLLDAYQLNIEQYVLSEALFDLLLVAAAALLLWRRPLRIVPAGLAGLLLAAAALTRGVAVFAVVPVLLTIAFLVARMPLRAGLSRAAAFLAVFAVAVGGYVVWYHSVHGTYALAGHTGVRLYGRVAPWVDCSEFSVQSYERVLCPHQPVGERPRVFRLVWAKSSPIARLDPPPGMTRSQVAGAFARRAILHQPLTYAGAVATDFGKSFLPTKETSSAGYRVAQWHFQETFPIPGYPPTWSTSPPVGFRQEESDGHVQRSLASFLRTYQSFGYTAGPLLALGLVLGLLAAAGLGRARRSGLRSAAFLFCGLAVTLSLGSLAVVPFSWRYQLPQLVLVPPAAVLGVTAFTRKVRA